MTIRHSIFKAVTLAAALGASMGAFAQGKGLDEPFRDGYRKTMSGKVVAYVPVALGFVTPQNPQLP